MRRSSSNMQIESVARDAAVKADYIADRTSTNARLGKVLQDLYAPVDDEQPAHFAALLTLLDRRFCGH